MANTHLKSFINEMKSILEAEEKHLTRELSQTADFPEYGRNDEDNATEIADFAAATSTTNTLKQRLNEVQSALSRITAGNYGITEDGRLIPEARLRANPAATMLVE